MAVALQRLDTPVSATRWLRSRVTGTLHTDSRHIAPGDGFIAWPGAVTDGRRHVRSALAQGAVACLVEREGADAFDLDGDAVAAYDQLKPATGEIASLWFGEPSHQLDMLAVTGTNGKTSSAWWLAQSLSNIEQTMPVPCGLVGTLGIGQPPRAGSGAAIEFNGLTTPDPVLLQRHLRRFVDEGLKACAIEASSIGIAEHRLAGTQLRVAIFTNLTQDHLDYHGTMQAYGAAKRALFDWAGLQAAVINVDDPFGAELAQSLQERPVDLWTVSARGTSARLTATHAGYGARGLRFTVVEGRETAELETGLIGDYNLSNLLGVLAAMRALGVPLASAVHSCASLSPVPGRMDCIGEPGEPMVVVDYAHTPDALDKALNALRPFAHQRGGALWCVFGCGGDRDAGKRPLMGQVAERHADRVVVTSDNPRSELPQAIVDQIVRGLANPSRVQVQVDRAIAIRNAVSQCGVADVVLVAGKGHEDYQEIAGVKHPFSDQAQARQALAQRGGRP
jgi:UDP-N-acetylmuramyl-tripeptide synthetase